MELVQPIRDKKQLENMKRFLKDSNLRDYCLFVLGINSGLRIQDLLDLQVHDVLEGRKAKDRISIKEGKTGKLKDFALGDNAKKAIKDYLDTRQHTPDEPVFKSRKGTGSISRVQAWTIINNAARAVGIKENIGTHTLRKTFGYHAYQSGQDIVLIQKLLNHSSPAVTLRYIGITQDQMDDVYLNINL